MLLTGVAEETRSRSFKCASIEPLLNCLRSLRAGASFDVGPSCQSDRGARQTEIQRNAALELRDARNLPAAQQFTRHLGTISEERQFVNVVQNQHVRAVEARRGPVSALRL